MSSLLKMEFAEYDIAIIGGGLAGLSLSIEQARAGRKVILFEKKSYPYHKVCGEYISNESKDYILQLGVDLSKLGATTINQLKVSAINGLEFNQSLDLGGFGISRYTLDYELSKIAKKAGVVILENTMVSDFEKNPDYFSVNIKGMEIRSTFLIGAHGKRSLVDKKLKRSFIQHQLSPTKNFIAIKYHIKCQLPKNLIGLHLFNKGYCGVSRIEENKYCLCYLTLQSNLDKAGSIEKMEEQILAQNPHLFSLLQQEKLYSKPIAISQISFSRKNAIEREVIMIGDAAGLIVPLCGNGMSMALHSAYKLNLLLNDFYASGLTKQSIEKKYKKWWKKEFGTRLFIGRLLQNIVYSQFLTRLTLGIFNTFPLIAKNVIQLTHGKKFS